MRALRYAKQKPVTCWLTFIVTIVTLCFIFKYFDVVVFKLLMRLSGYDPTTACLTFPISPESYQRNINLTRIFILNARPHVNGSIIKSWFSLDPVYLRINYSLTMESLQRLPRELDSQWFVNLNLTYINLFAFLLNRYPTNDAFIIVEDDVLLTAIPELFLQEVACAKHLDLPFYSFYDERRLTSSEYNYGTQAFYLTRSFARTFLRELLWYAARQPLDIILSEHHKLYKTRKSLVKHLGSRLN